MATIDGEDLKRLIRDPSGDTLVQDENGVWRSGCRFRCRWDLVFSLMPRRFQSKHPDFNNLICDRVSVSKEKPNIAVISVEYAGGFSTGGNFGSDSNTENAPVIEVTATATQEPIETHPDFADELAGTKGAELNGAVFDEEGRFEYFAQKDSEGVLSRMHGVSDYLAHRVVVRQTTIVNTQPNSVRVGFLEAPPVGGGISLKTLDGWRRQGAVYVKEEEWIGPAEGDDWNPLIYST